MSANVLKKLKKELSSMKPKEYNIDLEEIKKDIVSWNIPESSKEDMLNNLDSKKPHGIDFSKLKVSTLKESIAAFNNETLIIDDVTVNEEELINIHNMN